MGAEIPFSAEPAEPLEPTGHNPAAGHETTAFVTEPSETIIAPGASLYDALNHSGADEPGAYPDVHEAPSAEQETFSTSLPLTPDGRRFLTQLFNARLKGTHDEFAVGELTNEASSDAKAEGADSLMNMLPDYDYPEAEQPQSPASDTEPAISQETPAEPSEPVDYATHRFAYESGDFDDDDGWRRAQAAFNDPEFGALSFEEQIEARGFGFRGNDSTPYSALDNGDRFGNPIGECYALWIRTKPSWYTEPIREQEV